MFTLGELAKRFKVELAGDENCIIERVATLENAGPGDISFLTRSKYRKFLPTSQASAVIINAEDKPAIRTNALVSNNPQLLYAKIAILLYPDIRAAAGIHPSAIVDRGATIDLSVTIGALCVIEKGANIAANVTIGPGCLIGEDSIIGEDSQLVANVTLCRGSKLGQRVIVHPGVVIGSDGYGLANDQGTWLKIPQIGCVRIDDDVEIGANTTIDRGAIEDTIIESGVKLDNQIQVGHNVSIGVNTVIAAATAIAGSAKIGACCKIGGKVGIVGHLEIADNVTITGMSFVSKSIKKPGVYSGGVPLEPNEQWSRNFARYKQLDNMANRLKQLEKRLGKK